MISSNVCPPATSTPSDESLVPEQLLSRLVDSLEAMEAVQNLTRDVGTFVLNHRVEASRKRSQSGDLMIQTLKRKRAAEEAFGSSEPMARSSETSVKRMLLIYQHLQKTHALFQIEIAKFIDETEDTCLLAEESQDVTFISAE